LDEAVELMFAGEEGRRGGEERRRGALAQFIEDWC